MSDFDPFDMDFPDIGSDGESLEQYRPGGYHPVNIDDTFRAGRYRVLQKLGWGGFSTVWLIYDSMTSRLAALKVVVSAIGETSNEVRILQRLASTSAKHEGHRHLRKLTDYFLHDGPNGRHQCLVFEVDGISVPSLVLECPGHRRLPGHVAWQISKQITLALDCLHSNGIAHGDLHPGNILVSQNQGQFSDPDSLKDIGAPELTDISELADRWPDYNFPRHIPEPAELPNPAVAGQVHATLIDFEQSFLRTDKTLVKVCTPLVFRAPETLLSSTWDLRMDVWALAGTIFELVVGQPPFDNFMPAEAPLVLEWTAKLGDVPEEWQNRAKVVVGNCDDKMNEDSLSQWLCHLYFNGVTKGNREAEFSKEDIERLGDLLTKMMRYRPEERLSTQEILKHEWFAKNPLGGEDEE